VVDAPLELRPVMMQIVGVDEVIVGWLTTPVSFDEAVTVNEAP
jgi:hypothetical protein